MRLYTGVQQQVGCLAAARAKHVTCSRPGSQSSSWHTRQSTRTASGNGQLQTDAVPQAVAAEGQARVASVQVDVGYAVEQVSVELTHPDSYLLQAAVSFPLGVVFEDVAGSTQVTDITAGGTAEGAGVQVGDVLVATTAMVMQMTYPTMNLMFGGVGRPKLVKALVRCSSLPFPKAMDAIRSNTTPAGGDGAITLVLERRTPAAAAVAASSGATTAATSSLAAVTAAEADAGSGSAGNSTGGPQAVVPDGPAPAGVQPSSSNTVETGQDPAGPSMDGQSDGGVFDPTLFE